MAETDPLKVLLARMDTMETNILSAVHTPPPGTTPPSPPTISSIWDRLHVDDPIEEFDQTIDQDGWNSNRPKMTEYDHDEAISRAWANGADPAGRIIAYPTLQYRRAVVKMLLDPANAKELAPYRDAKIEPDFAFLLILLGVLDPDHPYGALFGVGPKVSDFEGQGMYNWVTEYIAIGGMPGLAKVKEG